MDNGINELKNGWESEVKNGERFYAGMNELNHK